jgi:hypothetical protein
MLLFCVRRRFLINPLETNGFRRILEARIASEQGETGSEQGDEARKAIGRMSGAEVFRRRRFRFLYQALEAAP